MEVPVPLEMWQFGLLGIALLLLALWLGLRISRRKIAEARSVEPAAKPKRAHKETTKIAVTSKRHKRETAEQIQAKKEAKVAVTNTSRRQKRETAEQIQAKKRAKSEGMKGGKPTGAKQPERKLVVFAREALAERLCAALPPPFSCVKNRDEFLAATKGKKAHAAFVDVDLLMQLKGKRPDIPIIGMIEDVPAQTLSKTVEVLDAFPWLSQVVTTTMLSSPQVRTDLQSLLDVIIDGPEQSVLGGAAVGRVALLAQSSHREARFERIHEFFSKHGITAKGTRAINDVCEELVMNALYDAPAEAGYFKDAVARTEEVTLPPERACEISYGIEGGNVFVRVRDTFGALSRERLVEVLTRCNSDSVALDESRGGAGLGLWRIFSTASAVAITVIPGQLTDVCVRMSTTNGRITKKFHAVHLFFAPEETDGSFDSLLPPLDDHDLMDQSITLVLAA